MNSIFKILRQDAPYLDSSRNKLLLACSLVVFILVFLTVYNPFNMNDWGVSILGYIGIGASVVLLNQFVTRKIFEMQKFKLYQLILSGIGEILVMTFFIYLIYSPQLPSFSEKLEEYLLTLNYVCLIISGPYILFVWFMASRERISSYKEVMSKNNLVLGSHKNKELLTITGENNKVILAINYGQLLYIKSSGNYLDIYYLKGETASKELVRVSLKELEAKITNSSIVRIHRSYMVNKHRISSFKKTRKGYKLLVQHAPEEILPVSLGYKDKFEEALELKVSH